MNSIDGVTNIQYEIEKNITPRGRYLEREDLFWEAREDSYFYLQRRLFFMTTGSFSVETRYVLEEKLRRLKKQVDAGQNKVYDVISLNQALDSMQVTKEDNPLHFSHSPEEDRVEF